MRTDDKRQIPEPTPFERFEALTKRLLRVPKREIAEEAKESKAPKSGKGPPLS